MNVLRKLLLVLSVVALAVVAAPTLASATAEFTEVLVKNTAADPVPVEAVGTTAVSGAVAVAGPVTTTPPVRWSTVLEVGSGQCRAVEPPRGHSLVVEQVILYALETSPSPGYKQQIWLQVGDTPLNVQLIHHFHHYGPGAQEFTGQARGPFVVGGPAGLPLAVCTRAGSIGKLSATGLREQLPPE